jgi:hypothetical protein
MQIQSTRSLALLVIPLALISSRGTAENQVRYDLQAEIAWARSTWPSEFKGAHFHSPLAKLLAWVRPGRTVVVYAYSPDLACSRVELTRDEEPPGELVGRTGFRIQKENGKKTRSFHYLSISELFVNEVCCSEDQEWGPDNKWHTSASGGIGIEGVTYGALSYVDDHVARFDGEPLSIEHICDGPYEWLPCASGGERRCNRCEDIEPFLIEVGTMFGGGTETPLGGHTVTCKDPCPSYPESKALARLNELKDHVSIWRPRGTTIATTPSLYKSIEDCRREHNFR